MATNNYKPHLLVLTEDDANRSVLLGFKMTLKDAALFRLEPVCGGWEKVIATYLEEQVPMMARFNARYVLLVIDFDNKGRNRLDYVREAIPEKYRERTFVMGCAHEVEPTVSAVSKRLAQEAHSRPNHKQRLGERLAQECHGNSDDFWLHDSLIHNEPERNRMLRTLPQGFFAI
jgi:hypothetical protein